MKTGKELKFERFGNYNVVFGSVNNKNPKAIYVNISAWAEPLKQTDINYNRVIKDINKKVKQELFNYFYTDKNSDFIKNNTIVDLDIRESGIRYGKRSFMSCEITLFLTSEIPVNSDKMENNLDSVIPMLIRNVFDNDKTFRFHKKKI